MKIVSDTYKILIVGAKHSGKRHYLASLLILLLDNPKPGKGWSLISNDDAVKTRNNMEVAYYRNKFIQFGQLLPNNYSYTFEQSFQLISRTQYSLAVELQCVPAEQFTDNDKKYEQITLLTEADGIIFLVDPFSFHPEGKLAKQFYQIKPASPDANEMLLLLIEYLRVVERAYSPVPLATPAAMVFTKQDAYKKFNTSASETPTELRSLQNTFNYYFQTKDIFYCSALGEISEAGRIAFQPFNVLSPFNWLVNALQKRALSTFAQRS
jgi:hypothetical protein